MKIQKIILIGLFAILSMTIGKSQSCYERLVDATGFNVSNQLNELEIAACELRFSLPEDYREQFTVYDMGFYSMNEYMAGGFQQVFNEKIQEVAAISNYYLLFGRQLPDSKGNAKIWMALKLPPSDVADCNNREATIIATLDKVFNPIDDPNKILTYEIEIMGLIRTLKKCEDCDNEMDDDGDGYIDCHDIDCMVEAFSLRGTKLEGTRSNDCYVPNEDEITFILEYANYLKLNGCGDTKSAIDLYADIKALEDLPIINQGFTREQLLQYIYRTQKLTRNRCTSYELHNDYITNWLYLTNGIIEEIPYEEIYKMAYWCQQLRDEIIALHLLQFGKDLLVALDIAAWELDLASTLRFFKAVPQGAKNYGIVRMVGKMEAPISSFSTLQYAQKFGINTYEDLGKIFKEMGWKALEKGVEFHHLIPVRFANKPEVIQWLGFKTEKWKCIVVKAGSAEHTPKFTKPWNDAIPQMNQKAGPNGLNTATASLQNIKDAAREIYKDFPEILQALGL